MKMRIEVVIKAKIYRQSQEVGCHNNF